MTASGTTWMTALEYQSSIESLTNLNEDCITKTVDVARLLVNIPGLVEVCWKLGVVLLETLQTYRDASKSTYLFANGFDMLWRNISNIIATIQRIEDKLSEERMTEIYQTLVILYSYECNH